MYPVIDATDWRAVEERLPAGRLEKDLLVSPDGNIYIFKWPNEVGEAWAEKVSMEVGRLFGLEMAEVELGFRVNPTSGKRQGTLSRHFRYQQGQPIAGRWEPGVDLLQEHISGYEMTAHYSYEQVRRILEPIGVLLPFHRMLIFDAVICNIDRHDENWEIRDRSKLAPVFDNGRTELAFRDHNQQRRLAMSEHRRRSMYARCSSALAWQGQAVEHFRLLEQLRQDHPDEFGEAVAPFIGIPRESVRHLVDELPAAFIPAPCRELAKVVLEERLDQLEGLA